MLQLLSGTTHVVITGVTVLRPAKKFRISTRVMSSVRMRSWSQKELERYVASGDWQGKAGGYGIQDERSDPFVIRMSGSHTNIVGLPMEATAECSPRPVSCRVWPRLQPMSNTKSHIFPLIVVLAMLALAGCDNSSPGTLPMAPMQIGSKTYQLEIAANDASREHGLMERDTLESDHGMIFLFREAQVQSFG